jgi:HD-GYP domain-containing protein (c-di-GMP phosphodiesterase class II)
VVEIFPLDRFKDGIEILLRKTLSDLGAVRGSLMVVDHRQGVLRIKVAISLDEGGALDPEIVESTRPALGEGVAGMVAVTQESLLINDPDELERLFPNFPRVTDPEAYRSSLVIPIVEDGTTVAVLNINDKQRGDRFTEKDLRLAEVLAEYCGVVLKLERQNQGVVLVNEIIREISLTNVLRDVYRMVVSRGADILECREASLMLVEPGPDGDLCLVVKESTDPRILGESRMLGESVSGYVWKTGEPILIKSVEDGEADRRFSILNKPGSFIVVPLNLKYQTPYALNVALKSLSTIGVLNFTHRFDESPFTNEHLESIINYSNLVAVAIEKARYYNDSKVAYLSTVKALSAAIESKDSYTRGHSDCVERLCARLASAMGFGPKELEDLQIAALLHDIGKIGIPEGVLNKKGPLTPEEYRLVQSHIGEAENILQHTFYLEGSRKIIQCHHERYDGAGYPAGLAGEGIPVGARILAVADAYHAMTSRRPYREALSIEKVREELIRCRGSHFDPVVVDHLLVMMATGDDPCAESQPELPGLVPGRPADREMGSRAAPPLH